MIRHNDDDCNECVVREVGMRGGCEVDQANQRGSIFYHVLIVTLEILPVKFWKVENKST